MLKKTLCLILLLCLSLSNAAIISCPKQKKKLLVIGDSLSASYLIPKDRGWVNLMRDKFTHMSLPISVYNVSISGQTAAQAVDRLPSWLDRFQPDYVILELGANDGLQGVSKKQLMNRFSKLISPMKRQDIKVLLLGIRLPPNYGESYLNDFSEAYQETARTFKLIFEPKMLFGVSDHKEMMKPDRLHPKAKAQPEILRHLWPKIAKLIGCQEEVLPMVGE